MPRSDSHHPGDAPTTQGPTTPSAGQYAALETPKASASAGVAIAFPVDPPTSDNSAASSSGDSSPTRLVPFTRLFTYADRVDLILMALGALGAVLSGIAEPIQVLFFGDIVNAFNPLTPMPPDDFRHEVNRIALKFVILGIAVVLFSFLQVACWSITAARQAKRIRSHYVHAILTQEIGWFDVNAPLELATRVADSTVMIQDGMGRKVGDGLNFMAMGLSGVILGFVKGWELALVLFAFTPLLAISTYISMRVLASATQAGTDSYAQAGAVAQESLGNIRTVHMFNAIQQFIAKYETALASTTAAGIRKGLAVGWGNALVFGIMFCTYAAGMFYGALKIVNDRRDGCEGHGCYDGGRVLTVFFSIVMGAMALGQAGPSIQAIYTARSTAYDVFSIIERTSKIDPEATSGRKFDGAVQGRIELENVTFAYPSRPEVEVCRDYSLTIEPGETVALVGPSGSGKSTVVSLLERFYDPLAGSVKLDGVDIRELNVEWLRRQVGLVGQEPALFATTIMENIRHGCPLATDEQVHEAARMANAYDFIMEFPSGFDTDVGERGTQLSGGQKQRIAIARAIIKNPPILLLDEATSALDTESERIVQESLDRLLAASKRTTIVVAHRLSTIRNADKIAVHSHGAIVELGTHTELMKVDNGHYRRLVEAQNRAKPSSKDDAPIPISGLTVEPTDSLKAELAKHRVPSFQKASSAQNLLIGGTTSVGDDQCDDNVSIWRIWRMSRPELRYLVLGSFGAVINAAVFPIYAVVFTKITVLFYEDKPRADVLEAARYWSLGFVGLGVVYAIAVTLQHYGFAVTSQRLVTRVRLATYTSMLQQEIGWFDLDENSSGALIGRLATDTATLQVMTSDTLNRGLVNVTTLLIGFIIAFYYSWRMSLVVLATAPIFIFTAIMQEAMMTGTLNNKTHNDADNAAGSLLAEAITSIRTVASFSMERGVNVAYRALLEVSKTADTKSGMIAGGAFGVAQGMMYFNQALLFYLGGKWVAEGHDTFQGMFMVLSIIIICTIAVGMAMQNMTDQSKAKKAARQIFAILDRTPAIDAVSAQGDVLNNVQGAISFRNLAFSYPSRPDSQVYKRYNLEIHPGQTVALVGASGSGKSTAIALLERFYDPQGGQVLLDGSDLRKLQLPWLRERISLVSQEPVLFAGTIADNIAMGKPGASREEVHEAARKANAYDFICQFPNGFDTDVGDRGAQVSGGQKQRIAIARAILRDPEVLLLDEATSALDNESERVVQESLDRLMALKKRTTIVVAHRLSTIRHADLIAVTKDGAIVEQGTHDELMQIPNGHYQALVARQLMGNSVN